MPKSAKGGSSTARGHTSRTRRLHLLSVPLELREHVYRYLVNEEEPEILLNVLEVNHQLSREAKPFLFKRRLVFYGQHDLFTWVRRVGREFLCHVADISFQLHDIKPDEIVGALGKRLRQAERNGAGGATKDNPYHEACDREVHRIAEAFSLMPNVKTFSIIACTESDPRPSYRMLSTFSKMLARYFPNLRTLRNKESSLPINFITNKPKLRSLQIPSQTPSSTAEVTTCFAGLSVTSLSVYGAPEPIIGHAPQRDVVAEMLRAVRPLTALTLFESDVKYLPQDVAHDLLVRSPDAIGKHLHSLKTLKISIEYSAEMSRVPATLSQLHKFLKSSSISRLEMAEPLVFTLDHRLPPSVDTFVIRLDRPSKPDTYLAERISLVVDQLESLTDELKRPSGARVPNLREVVMLLEGHEDVKEIEDFEEVQQARDLLEGTGIRLTVEAADPDYSL